MNPQRGTQTIGQEPEQIASVSVANAEVEPVVARLEVDDGAIEVIAHRDQGPAGVGAQVEAAALGAPRAILEPEGATGLHTPVIVPGERCVEPLDARALPVGHYLLGQV